MTFTDVTSLIVALATVGSLLYISRQVGVTRQQTKGQFLLALDAQFEKSSALMARILNEAAFVPVDAEWYEVWQAMSVFERMSIMVEDRILDAGLVDRLYGIRLITIIANDAIYQRLAASGAEWQDFIDLCYAIADLRQRSSNIMKRDANFVERVHRLTKTTRNANTPWGF